MLRIRFLVLLAFPMLLSAQIRYDPKVGIVPHRPPDSTDAFNLDFENSFNGAPALWTFVNAGNNEYQQALDTTVSYSGSQSLRISSASAPSSDKGYSYQEIPSTLLKGHTLHLSGAIRTAQNTNGFATIFVEVDEAVNATVVNLQPNAPTATTDWQVYTVSAALPADVSDVLFGVTLHGSGTAWFDHLSIDVDGVPLALSITTPGLDQVRWLRQNATPFTSLDPAVKDAELDPLKAVIGNARVVGLGEGTHGTSEFFRMKSMIVSYLARNLGFTIFAIEANMPEAYKMNDYVLNGNGDPKQLLAGMYFWTWNTQEVLDMVTWMRQFNASGQGKIEFLGFDMQYAGVAMSNVGAFVARADPGLMGMVAANYANVAPVANQALGAASSDQVSTAIQAAQAVWRQLVSNRASYVQQQSPGDVDWAIQNAQIVVQAVTLPSASSNYRDSQMALNVEWIATQNPNSRIVLWAHDYHISRQPSSMGEALGQYFGANYVTIGQFFHAGSYNAINSTGLGPNVAEPSFPASMEYAFHQTGVSQQILDLHLAQPANRDSSWLFGTFWDRTIGAVAEPGFILDSLLTKEFDAIVFFDRTNPSTLLPFPFAITTSTLPNGTVGTTYLQDLVATYSPGPTWSVVQGTLPPGLVLKPGGLLSGVPTTAGQYSFTISAFEGSASVTGSAQITIQ
jgi:erythromycin esterase